MPELDLDRLEALAKAAESPDDNWPLAATLGRGGWGHPSGPFVDACDPSTVLALVAEVRRLRETVGLLHGWEDRAKKAESGLARLANDTDGIHSPRVTSEEVKGFTSANSSEVDGTTLRAGVRDGASGDQADTTHYLAICTDDGEPRLELVCARHLGQSIRIPDLHQPGMDWDAPKVTVVGTLDALTRCALTKRDVWVKLVPGRVNLDRPLPLTWPCFLVAEDERPGAEPAAVVLDETQGWTA